MPKKGKLVSFIALLFILLVVFLPAYEVGQRQIYKGEAATTPQGNCDLTPKPHDITAIQEPTGHWTLSWSVYPSSGNQALSSTLVRLSTSDNASFADADCPDASKCILKIGDKGGGIQGGTGLYMIQTSEVDLPIGKGSYHLRLVNYANDNCFSDASFDFASTTPDMNTVSCSGGMTFTDNEGKPVPNPLDVSSSSKTVNMSVSVNKTDYIDKVRFVVSGTRTYELGLCETWNHEGCPTQEIGPFTLNASCLNGSCKASLTPGGDSILYTIKPEFLVGGVWQKPSSCNATFETIWSANGSATTPPGSNPTPTPGGDTPTPTPGGSPTPVPTINPKADVNGDGCVNSIDLGILIDGYNPAAPSCSGN